MRENKAAKLQPDSATENVITYYVYDSPVGRLTIVGKPSTLLGVYFGVKKICGECRHSELTDRAAFQLEEYFAGKRQQFALALETTGTPFQKLVWAALQSIPYGETRSYKQIAEMIGKPGACRAVGMANNHNPISIIIPCHRVIGADSSLVGYGAGLFLKEWLLALERENCRRK